MTLVSEREEAVPNDASDDVLLGRKGFPYVRKVVSARKQEARLEIQTTEAPLEEALPKAKYGIPERPQEITAAQYFENCEIQPSKERRAKTQKPIRDSFRNSISLSLNGSAASRPPASSCRVRAIGRFNFHEKALSTPYSRFLSFA